LKTDSGYPRDLGIFFHLRWQTLGVPFALTTIGQVYQSLPSPVPGDLGPAEMSESPVSRNLNIERHMDRPKSVVGVIRGVAF